MRPCPVSQTARAAWALLGFINEYGVTMQKRVSGDSLAELCFGIKKGTLSPNHDRKRAPWLPPMAGFRGVPMVSCTIHMLAGNFTRSCRGVALSAKTESSFVLNVEHRTSNISYQ